MRTLKLVLALLGSLVVIVTCAPLLWALRRDRHERNALDVGDEYPYDDNDPGVDVDDGSCEVCGWPDDSVLPCLCDDADVGGES